MWHHEEADTKIIYHICNTYYDANILIKGSDTDIVIIMLGCMNKLTYNTKIWMEVGTGNNVRYLDITLLYTTVGKSVSKALPAFHAFTGCDYSPAFYRKGKNNPLKILEKSDEFQDAFGMLGTVTTEDALNIFPTIEKFVCNLYGVKNLTDINEVRLAMFTKNYKSNNINEKFEKKFRNYDASSLPPCQSELKQQFLRTQYITSIWWNADLKNPTTLSPVGHGWVEIDKNYEFMWFEGDQLPAFVKDVIIEENMLPTDDDEGMK